MSDHDASTDDALEDRAGLDQQAALDAQSLPGTYKIRGQLDDPAGTGVHGAATATSGEGRGVVGTVSSPHNDAAGVRGKAPNDASGAAAHGVVGTTQGTGQERSGLTPDDIATGVTGRATNTAGVRTFGVYGSTQSPADGDAGVFGLAVNDQGETAGVRGATNSAATGAAGVQGAANSGSGAVYGVSGTTDSPDGAGVHATATAGAPVALSATGGVVAVDQWGVAVGANSSQTIKHATETTVAFDQVETDPRGEWTGSPSYEFSPDVAGDYRVETTLLWSGTLPSNDTQLRTHILVNGSKFAIDFQEGVDNAITTSLSKVLTDLSPSDTVSIMVFHDEGSDLELADNTSVTYASFRRLG